MNDDVVESEISLIEEKSCFRLLFNYGFTNPLRFFHFRPATNATFALFML